MLDAARFRARSTSHPVAARDGCTNIPLAAGRGSGERNHSGQASRTVWTTLHPLQGARHPEMDETTFDFLGLTHVWDGLGTARTWFGK